MSYAYLFKYIIIGDTGKLLSPFICPTEKKAHHLSLAKSQYKSTFNQSS